MSRKSGDWKEFYDKHKRNITGYIVCLLLGASMAYFAHQNPSDSQYSTATLTAAQNFWRVWSNTFTIPGVILVCVGLLSLISREGTFDTLAYAGRAFIRMFQSGRRHQRFGDFVMERREKRKEKKSMVAPFMVVGGLFVAAAVFCLVMYYQVS